MGNIAKTLLKLLAFAILYGVIGVLLYRQRVTSDAAIWDSDVAIFVLPALLSLVANGLIILTSTPVGWYAAARGAVACVWAILVTFFTAVVYMTLAFNIYGT